jgi:hypothetical protein
MVGAAVGRGLRAALMLPRGVDEKVMFCVAPVEIERTGGRSGARSEGEVFAGGLEGTGGEEGDDGDDGEGASRGDSGSKSPSGVEVVEAIVKRK